MQQDRLTGTTVFSLDRIGLHWKHWGSDLVSHIAFVKKFIKLFIVLNDVVVSSVAELEQGLFGRSWSRCVGPAPPYRYVVKQTKF